jgi:hypothetical protein
LPEVIAVESELLPSGFSIAGRGSSCVIDYVCVPKVLMVAGQQQLPDAQPKV